LPEGSLPTGIRTTALTPGAISVPLILNTSFNVHHFTFLPSQGYHHRQ
jgi:hypothetical protein